MKRFSEQLHKQAKSVKMTAAERTDIRERLVAYMEYHPLPAELKTPVKKAERIKAEAFNMVQIPYGLIFRSSFVMAAVVLVLVPVMAERAVPGDALYAVKVQFNEEVRSTLTFDAYERVEWETERLNRRIAEARLLASEGRLTEAVEAEVAEAVREHSQNAQKGIEEIRAVDADGATIASIELDTTLEVQSASLREVVEEEQVETLVKKNVLADAIDDARPKTEVHGTTTVPGYDKLMARVEQNTTRVYELRDSIASVIAEENLTDINRRIADLERSIEEAMVAAEEEEDKMTARQSLVNVLQRSQKLIVFMTELEVSATVDIEEIVPVVLTTEEELAQVEAWKQEISTKRATATELLREEKRIGESPDLVEKIDTALAEVDLLIEEMGTTTEFAAIELITTQIIEQLDNVLSAMGYGEEAVIETGGESQSPATEVDVPEDRGTSTTPVDLPEGMATGTPTTSPTTGIGTGTVDTE